MPEGKRRYEPVVNTSSDVSKSWLRSLFVLSAKHVMRLSPYEPSRIQAVLHRVEAHHSIFKLLVLVHEERGDVLGKR